MKRRQGFTIIEMLVSLALILFIMVILTEAFSAGSATFRQLKALGDLNERLRTATSVLRQDLSADHFEGHRRLSDPTFWSDGYPALGFLSITSASPLPPTQQQPPASNPDGIDSSLSYPGYLTSPLRCPPPPPNNLLAAGVANCPVLSCAVKLRGNSREDYFSANATIGGDTTLFNYNTDAQFQDVNGTYNSQWAEVTYILAPNGTSAGSQTPLYTLYRSQLVVVPDNRNLMAGQPAAVSSAQYQQYYDMSCYPSGQSLYFNTPGDLTNPTKRAFWTRGTFNPSNPGQWGAAFLLSDVISFDVRVLRSDLTNGPDPYFVDVRNCNTLSSGFDTANPTIVNNGTPYLPNNYVIKAVQITIRLWDLKTQQTRQVTIVQDL
jgi:prepilin-type N-terminal cleavage/methylation domain-containing protein